MPAFTVPIHEANDCHLPAGRPDGGQFCSKGSQNPLTVGWKPSMTRSEAHSWTQRTGGTPFMGTVVVSSKTKADAIASNGFSLAESHTGRVWGDGVYLGLGWDSEAYYRYLKRRWADAGGSQTLEVTASLKQPWIVEVNAPSRGPYNLTDAVEKLLPDGPWLVESWRKQPGSPNKRAIEHLQSLGYDGIIIKAGPRFPTDVSLDPMHPRFGRDFALEAWAQIGGQQIVVFDPKQVTVTRVRPSQRKG